ncbi:DUF922 domain-containing protein [Emticicia sp. 17c]|uniref:DUF922 domain-containing protein n=1 Tax=Emticicia sp. 17c TaxID=3127704 RepID=UPI00301BB46C
MQNIFKSIAIALCCFYTSALLAQPTITLNNVPIGIHPVGYYIAGVTDSRLSKENVGTIITSANDKAVINMAGGVQNQFQHFLSKNLSRNASFAPILYNITALNISESKGADGYISGKVSLVVNFERIRTLDTALLVTSNVYTDYKRRGGASGMNNYEVVLRSLIVQTIQYFDGWMEINYKKHEALIKGITIKLLTDYAVNDSDTIYYNTRKINWDDFRARPTASNRYGASIFSNFAYTSSFKVSEGLIQAFIQTRTYMVRGMSWAIESAKNDYALAHEQLHFDITRLVVERFKKKVLAMQAETIDDLNSMIQYEYLESYKEMNKLQKEYDSETRHSLDTIRQAEWANKIRTWLAEITS